LSQNPVISALFIEKKICLELAIACWKAANLSTGYVLIEGYSTDLSWFACRGGCLGGEQAVGEAGTGGKAAALEAKNFVEAVKGTVSGKEMNWLLATHALGLGLERSKASFEPAKERNIGLVESNYADSW